MGLGCRLGPPDYQRAILGTSRVTLPFSPQAAPLCSRSEEAGVLTRDEYEEDSSDEEVGLGLDGTSCEVRTILPGLSWCLKATWSRCCPSNRKSPGVVLGLPAGAVPLVVRGARFS